MRSLETEIVKKRNMADSYRVITPDVEKVKVFEVGMLTECSIRSLLEMEATVLSGVVSYNYKISGLLSLDNIKKNGKLTGEVADALFKSLYNCFDEIADYMLVPGNILLTQSEVFFTDDLRKAYFMYVPQEEKDPMTNEEIIDFAEEILNTAENIDREVIMYMYSLICELKEENGTLKTAIEKAERITFKESEEKAVKEVKAPVKEVKEPIKEQIQRADNKARRKDRRKQKKNEILSERKKKLLEYMDFTLSKHDKFKEKKEERFIEEDYEEKDSEFVYLA